MNQFRQGDLLFTRIDVIPVGKKILDGVIVRGEATGHAHRLIGGSVIKDKNGNLYLDIKTKGEIIHEEHKPIQLSKGKWAVIRQREYTNADAVRIVRD